LAWQATAPSKAREIKNETKYVPIFLDTGRRLQLGIIIV
jgi:hypothetical protein